MSDGNIASIEFAGTGEAESAAHSDHDHDSDYLTSQDLSSGSTTIAWSSITGVPGDLNSGGTAASVDWTDIKNRPEGLDDGDDGITSIDWNEI
ncbi:MAG TPA: hypothetical protein DHV68_03850 [Dehalococcoidia bacterium]|nr:hypothetical protein [Chloroflexota bacterium]HCI85959.1 hypothetical protein [Dehalococcoidia bacterium]|tara:strand:- start:11288 stop:11566 length:279 start_codon:yes stop_codon:yes gene_type:complete